MRPLKHIGVIPNAHRTVSRLRQIALSRAYVMGADRLLEFGEWVVEEVEECTDLTAFGLSCQNKERPEAELDAILVGAHHFADEAIKRQLQVHPFGFLDEFRTDPKYASLYDKFEILKAIPRVRGKLTYHIAANYSGLPEHEKGALLDDVEKYGIQAVREGLATHQHGLSAGVPDMQLVIRPGNDNRLSGFLPDQSAYAELRFVEKAWVDYTRQDLKNDIAWYRKQTHRFGK